ncbi:MAG TPA: glycoside hydrolase, partial [Verrucomicrobiae bacterium]|nr:glycoside hydrolase [Verrucomicrobiae bacterium]
VVGAAGGLFAETPLLQVRINPHTKYQVIDGFGASDAWRCEFVGKNWPREKRDRIADLLFSRAVDPNGNPKGIGLSLWRFNIGAGTAEQGDASGIHNPWRRAECFQSPDGTYNWSKQQGQQWFLRAARDRGVERFLAFANSPPVHLTRNGKGYAAKHEPYFNIKPGEFDAYAGFLADVLEHFQKEGLPFDYLSPFNEPQWAWDNAAQEGTPGQNIELQALVRYLSAELFQRKLSTQLVIGEAGTIGHVFMMMTNFPGADTPGRDAQAQFFFSPASPFYLGNLPNVALLISAHDYYSVWPLEKQVEYRQALHQSLAAANPRLGYWQSEYCILEPPNSEVPGGAGRDLGMNTALYVARLIHHDLTIALARSWQWWTAISEADYKDGLVYLDDGSMGATGKMGPKTHSLMRDGVVRESKLLWAFGNYSRFVRPGMTRVACTVKPEQSYVNGLLASAYKGPRNKLVVVLVNLSPQEKRGDIGQSREFEVYTTCENANLERRIEKGSSVTLPGRSVVTCVSR